MYLNSQRQITLPMALGVVSLLFALTPNSYAANTMQVKAINLENVTVFLHGAELFGSVPIELPAGESEVVLTNVANQIDERSLVIGTNKDVFIQSTNIKRDYLTAQQESPQAEKLKAQLEEQQKKSKVLEIQIQVLNAKQDVLMANKTLSKDGTVAIEDISKMLDLVSAEMNSVLSAKLELEQRIEEIKKQTDKIQRQLKEEQKRLQVSANQVVVKLYSPKATQTSIKLSYAISNAGWLPSYDLRAENDSPITITYKAEIFQSSGIDWQDVKLSLSTGNPSEGANAPVLSPWYVSLYQEPPEVVYGAMPIAKERMRSVKYSNAAGAVSTVADMMSEEVIQNYIQVDSSGINTRYDIALPYTIPSDGKTHLVTVKQSEVKGEYRYVVVPKYDRDAFLQAQIADWQYLNLLPGKSQIYYNGSFIGEGFINPNEIKEKLNISFGREKRIIVSRENDKAMKSKPEFFGNNITQQDGYTINVRNTNERSVKLVVFDQVPISRDSEVIVNDVKYNPTAEYNKETGMMQWTLELKSGEERKLVYSYNVKYPKDKHVTGL